MALPDTLRPCICNADDLQTETQVPVAIVGAGACGLTAALALHRLGVDCVLLERDAFARGSTALSSGFIPAPGTRAQKALGVQDSPEQFVADIQAKSHGFSAPLLAEAYARAIAPALDALEAQNGIPWRVLDGFLYPGHSSYRMHCVPEKTGAGLMNRLLAATDLAEIPVLTQARVTELWCDTERRVHGIGYVRPDGSSERLRCDVLLLACNGFGGEPSLVRELLPDMAEATYAGHVGNDGSAVLWGRALGAHLADLTAYQGHGSWAVPQGALISWALMMEGGIQVNASGQRFHDETQGYSEAAVHVLAQPGGVAWNVFDDALLEFAQQFPDFVEAQAAGAVQHCADTEALALLIGCPRSNLEATLAQCSAGVEAVTGRSFKRALRTPLHAIRVTGALFHTQGGLDINAAMQVLRSDGTAFPNLLAAGGAARGVSGNAVWGYLSGNGLLSAVAGGHIAAYTAKQLIEDAKA
jgi:fumarate reductase flavoprotein subunit